jgi:hypothetical protein
MATASLVLALVSCASVAGSLAFLFYEYPRGVFFGLLFAGPFAGLLAVVCGHVAKASARTRSERLAGKHVATGLILGYLGLAGSLFSMLAASGIDFATIAANPASAVGSLRTINTAAIVYSENYHRGFPPSLASLGPPKSDNAQTNVQPSETAAALIDDVLASGAKSGYRFIYAAGPEDSDGRTQTYTLRAEPLRPGKPDTRYFFTDQSGLIRYEDRKQANSRSPVLQ